MQGLQMPTTGNVWPQATQNAISMVGGYMPPVNYGLNGVGTGLGTGLQMNTGVNLDAMGGGQGLGAPQFGPLGQGNSVLGQGNQGSSGLGFNLGTLNMGINGIAAIGGLYNAFQSNKLAKEQFAFTKEITNTNLNNQIKSFNTSMEDRARARARLDGRTDVEDYTASYVDKNKLERSK